jgi:hypothetical protein
MIGVVMSILAKYAQGRKISNALKNWETTYGPEGKE